MNQGILNQKLKLMLASQSLEDKQKAEEQRKVVARLLLAGLQSTQEWMKIQTLKILFLYKDLEEVISAVQILENRPESSEFLRIEIQKFYDGNLDVANLLEERKKMSDLKDMVLERRRAELEMVQKTEPLIPQHLELLQMKIS
jgi:cell division protein FtsB